jgi:2-polyprenyl-3-methyl-5-hydroxy-6-metoxy-1,4-benzoquinol methylase
MTAELEDVPCPLCGDARKLVRHERPYRLGSVSDAASFAATTDEFSSYGRVVACVACGHLYTSPRPSAAALLGGYEGCVDDAYLTESSSRSINAHLSLSTIKRCSSGGRLLELGSSVGYFLNAARVDFDVVGVEPSDWARKIARERFKLEVLSLKEAEALEPASFDVAAMIDVLEHVTDPKQELARAVELLKPGGVLYLVTPDVSSLSAKILGSYWWGLRPAHVQYFSEERLSKLLGELGFEIVLAKSFGRIFTWGYWATRLKNYPWLVRDLVDGTIRELGIEKKFLYLDTRDSIEICARKR